MFKVGQDIESICGKCGDVWHVVVAMNGTAIAKVGIDLFDRVVVDTQPPFWFVFKIDTPVLLFVVAASGLAALVAGVPTPLSLSASRRASSSTNFPARIRLCPKSYWLPIPIGISTIFDSPL